MEYSNVNGYLIPNLTLNEEPEEVCKYGSLRRQFLMEQAPFLFDQMLMEGTLYPHLREVDHSVREQMEQTMQALMQQSSAPSRQTHPLEWAQWMNSLKHQAEELAMEQIYSL